MHFINFPVFVRPSAPPGEQNAPGCTPLLTVSFVFVGRGFGFLVVGFGFGVAFFVTAGFGGLLGDAFVRVGDGLTPVVAGAAGVVLTMGAANRGAAGCSAVTPGRAAGLSSSAKAPMTVTPPQQRTRKPTTDRITMLTVLRFGFTAGCGAVGCCQGCLGSVTRPLWCRDHRPSIGRSCLFGRFPADG